MSNLLKIQNKILFIFKLKVKFTYIAHNDTHFILYHYIY
jgi:hypothetical protein